MQTRLFKDAILFSWVHIVEDKMSLSQMHAFGAKVAFIPTLLWNLLRSRIDRNWYDRITETIVLGALPFHSTARKVYLIVLFCVVEVTQQCFTCMM